MTNAALIWIGFTVFVLVMLVLDLGVFHRKSHVIGVREALWLSAFWIALALAFNIGVYYWRGPEVGLQFLTGYLVEKALSVDNIFVFWSIFTYFNVPAQYQHRVLTWGILGALLMRAVFILVGIELLHRVHGIIYVFGTFLVLTGIRLVIRHAGEIHPEKNPILRIVSRWLPVTRDYVGGHFFLRADGRLLATPLFLVLLVVESTDLIFAVDSIPAILAISQDPFIVYTSNVFAILGLRALYFALAGIVPQFRFLHYGLAAILIFVGIKMLLMDFYKVPIVIALGVVGIILIVSAAASLLLPGKVPQEEATIPG